MGKRLIVCSDGTWNSPDRRYPTNVVKLSRSILPTAPDGTVQSVFYDPGVGTGNLLDKITGGAFGAGLDKNIEDAYRFLMLNYDDGDEIFLFGFSRGAYTVRSTAGLIRKSGLLHKQHADRFQEAYKLYRKRDDHPDMEGPKQFRARYSREVTIYFIGVWDTVGALGIPVRGLRWLTKSRYQFHDVELSKYVKNGYQALAIDERRGPFRPSIWSVKEKPGQTVEQVWFSGVHSDVGGGFKETGLSDTTFLWMEKKAAGCGLVFDDKYINTFVHPDWNGVLHNSMTGLYMLTRGYVRQMTGGKDSNEAVDSSAVKRHQSGKPPYAPANLVAYLNDPSHKETS